MATGGSVLAVVATALAMVLAFLQKLPCRAGAWDDSLRQFQEFCYTDIYPLYSTEGFADGKVAYLGHAVEYPVLLGGTMQAAASLVAGVEQSVRARTFYDVTAALLAVCAVVGVTATVRAAGGHRFRQTLMIAFAPALVLSAFVNWDLLALLLVGLWLAAWSTRRTVLAGIALGLAVATKFYPVLFLGPLLLLCLRAGRLRALGQTVAAATAAWTAVNLPVYLLAPAGWKTFYTFSAERGADWGSIWFFFQYAGVRTLDDARIEVLNHRSLAVFVGGCVLIAALALLARRRPRLPQLCFLVLVAFLIPNKVWSPQYVIWLVPLAVLARPRLWPYVFWQLTEVVYFFAIWGYLVTYVANGSPPATGFAGITDDQYFPTVLLRSAGLLLLAAYVVVDILRPDHDLVRADSRDDPAGGVLDGAEDWFRLRRASR